MMMTIAGICFAIIYLIGVFGIVKMIQVGIRDDEQSLVWVGAVIALILIGGTCAFCSGEEVERKNPCVAWDPPVTTYMMVGKILTPVTTTPCVRRQNETEQ